VRPLAPFTLMVTLGATVLGCAPGEPRPGLPAEVELVVLHTSDTHSQLFPFPLLIGPADAARGLGSPWERRSVGGFARLATVLARERTAGSRVVHVDSGDLFQGSRSFERFGGEPEVLGLGALGVDAQVLGNHELDGGAAPLLEHYGRLATFPLVAANLLVESGGAGLSSLVRPFAWLDAGGLRVAVIGVGNVGSVRLLGERPSELGVLATAAAPAVQARIDQLRPDADVVVLATHLGLSADEALVAATSGADLVLGGHQHLTLDEPVWVSDCSGGNVEDGWGQRRACGSRRVPIVHSGAYGKFVGRLRLELDALLPGAEPLDGYEVAAADLELLPVQERIPEDPRVLALLEPYAPKAPAFELAAFAPRLVERFGATGGDSPLGNLAATAARRAALSDLALIGASSLRHDLPPGLVDDELLVRVLPFEDPIVRVRIPGASLLAALEQAARSTSGRDCRTQLHVAGAVARLACPCAGSRCARLWVHETAVRCRSDADCSSFDGACDAAEGDVGRCRAPVLSAESYELATTEYHARGGSGLLPAVREGEGVVVSDTLASAVLEHLRDAPACAPRAEACADACPAALLEATRGASCEAAVAACSELPCVGPEAGAVRDGRIRFEAR
jgi:5'-nucleotidase / UDP-sugar diphosphatase